MLKAVCHSEMTYSKEAELRTEARQQLGHGDNIAAMRGDTVKGLRKCEMLKKRNKEGRRCDHAK